MVQKSELFYDENLKVDPTEFNSREAFLNEIENGCSPDMKAKIIMKGGGAIMGGIGAALLTEGAGVFYGGFLGYRIGAGKLSEFQQDCKLRNTEGALPNEIWGKPPVLKDQK